MIFQLNVAGFLPDLREMFHRWFLYLVRFMDDFKLNVGGFLPDPREMFHRLFLHPVRFMNVY